MVTAYWLPVKTAAAIFPLLALLLFVPTAVVLYRRHGGLPRGRVLSLCAFAYCMLTAACLTLLPLPKSTADMCSRYALVAEPEWRVGHTFGDIWKEADREVGFGPLVLDNPAVAGAVFNLLLLLPLGVFVRCHLRRGPAVTLLAGCGVALFFEVAQGTGLWGAYPCPYRLFDVDDLVTNSAGAAIGWMAAGPLVRALPVPGPRAQANGLVPFGRRLTALVVDVTGCAITAWGASMAARYGMGADPSPLLIPLLVCALWFAVPPHPTRATPGMRLLRLRFTGLDGGKASRRGIALRQLLLIVIAFPSLLVLLAPVTVMSEWLTTAFLTVPVVDERWVAGVADNPWPLLDALGLQGALLSPLLVAVVPIGYAVLALCHREQLGAHELLSGVRTRALPPTSAPAGSAPGRAGEREGVPQLSGQT
ncbi:VanZ like family protein [Streptomyces sp. ADI96-02]|uniref:VanZ family protein n=1 Tax=Streptomyces sp. ADI96-02 TaxID=1522760 RepID=UPI000FA4B2D6|nr:VanZ family protein [Streptomyces sp. ADI96-02]RPK60591.1 VanZ like family protein [Streptomyces sp. ADI96-02]